MTSRLRLIALAIATTAIMATTAASQAHAALLKATLSVPSGTPVLTATISSPLVEGLDERQHSAARRGRRCRLPAGQNVATAVPATSTVADLACAVGALDYQLLTRLDSPTGPIVKTHGAIVNLPTPINVDADILPDVIVTLQVLSLDRFTLRVDRMLGETAALPMSLEAIVDDPTGGALPREHINAGFDARGSRTPVSWITTATLPEDGDDNLTTLNTSTDVTGGGASITTLGGLFDGTALDRKDPLGGRLRYTPVPPNATLGLSLGTYLEVRAGSSVPTLVEGDAEIVEGPSEQRVEVDITGLPSALAVRSVQPGIDRRTVTYAANAPVPALDATYRETVAGALVTSAVVHARGLPLGMTLAQTAARVATFEATSPLGSVEVGYGAGREPVLLDVEHPYARVIENGEGKSYAGRIDALLKAAVDATDDVVADLQLGPDGRRPFRALIDRPTLDIDASVSNLPRHMKVQWAPDTGHVEYDAFGETVDRITLDAVQSTPFFERVTEIHAKVTDLPSQAAIDIKPNGGGFRLETNNPIGEAEALLTSGPQSSLPAGVFGAKIEDLADRFTVFARVKGLRLVDITTGPGTRITTQAKLASTPFKVLYDKNDLALDLALATIPSDVKVTLDPTAGTVDYLANGGHRVDRCDALVDRAVLRPRDEGRRARRGHPQPAVAGLQAPDRERHQGGDDAADR